VWSRRAVKTLFSLVARDFSFSFIYGLKCDQKIKVEKSGGEIIKKCNKIKSYRSEK
jgi:hypothetical protein